MPLVCVVPGYKNNSSNPDCYELQWHRLPSKQEPIKRRLIVTTLGLPNDITAAKRICSSCMSRVPKGRKPPAAMENVTSVSGHRRYTRTELLQAVALDHCYSHPPEQEPPTQKRSTSTAPANIIGPLVSPEAPLLDVFCVEMYSNSNDALHRFHRTSTSRSVLAFLVMLLTIPSTLAPRLIHPVLLDANLNKLSLLLMNFL